MSLTRPIWRLGLLVPDTGSACRSQGRVRGPPSRGGTGTPYRNGILRVCVPQSTGLVVLRFAACFSRRGWP